MKLVVGTPKKKTPRILKVILDNVCCSVCSLESPVHATCVGYQVKKKMIETAAGFKVHMYYLGQKNIFFLQENHDIV
jgi:hypothetical protein